MIYDFVKCTNCETEEMLVTRGEEICPECKAVGTLAWMDEEEPEIEV